MKTTWILGILLTCSTLFFVGACEETSEPLTQTEAQEGLDETMLSSVEASLEADMVEISTQFTMGAALDKAVQQLKMFVSSQIPCSVVTETQNTITIDFGTLEDNCTYLGKTYAGIITITVVKTSLDSTTVTQDWDGLTNGKTTANGTVTVVWDKTNKTRNVVHELVWTRNGKDVFSEGNRTQSLLDETLGAQGGIRIDGFRTKTAGQAMWMLDIDGVEMRPQDPVPQAGVYTLTRPNGKTITYEFVRIDEDTIEVTVTGAKKSFVFHVTSSGQVDEV
ncbi:MAG: hypothetical protein HUU55_19100 [Myxococcales bacterium]|nr:hypothetical protein [Myxococcales bacterium]